MRTVPGQNHVQSLSINQENVAERHHLGVNGALEINSRMTCIPVVWNHSKNLVHFILLFFYAKNGVMGLVGVNRDPWPVSN